MRGGGKAPHVRVAKPAAQAPAGLDPKGRRAAGRLRPVARPAPTPRGVMSSTPRLFPRRPVRRRRRGKRRGRRPEGGSLTEGLTRRDVWSRTPCACRARGDGRCPRSSASKACVKRDRGVAMFEKLAAYREGDRLEVRRTQGGSPTQPLGDLLGLCQQLGWRHPAWRRGAARHVAARRGRQGPEQAAR